MAIDNSPQKTTPQDITLNFKVNNQPIVIKLNDVNQLFTDINKYNDQFSLGSTMARMLILHFEPNEEQEDTTQLETGVGNEGANQQASAFFLISKHRNLLNNIGLSLEPVSGKGAIIQNEEGSVGAGEMRINVSRQDHFTSFLKVLEPEQIETTGLRDYLGKIPAALSQQVLDHYDLQTPGTEAIQLFEGLEVIIAEYKRLKMDESITRLETYLQHGKIGDLREYVAIERKGLFSKPGKWFGPADWQKDSSPESLENRWNEAVAILQMTKSNPKARDLYNQLLSHLTMCIDHALTNLPTLNYLSPESRLSDQTILEVAQQKLNLIAQDSPQI